MDTAFVLGLLQETVFGINPSDMKHDPFDAV